MVVSRGVVRWLGGCWINRRPDAPHHRELVCRPDRLTPAPSNSAAWGGDAYEDHLRSMAAT